MIRRPFRPARMARHSTGSGVAVTWAFVLWLGIAVAAGQGIAALLLWLLSRR